MFPPLNLAAGARSRGLFLWPPRGRGSCGHACVDARSACPTLEKNVLSLHRASEQAYMMPDGLIPAISYAGGPDQRAAVQVRSISPPARCFGDSPAPMTFTSGHRGLLAISGRVSTSASPPSLITQQ